MNDAAPAATTNRRQTSPSSHILTLDAARGLAALFVMIYHLDPFLSLRPYFSKSYLAVDLFFLMSGFVVAKAYEFKLKSGSMRLFGFCKVRLIRLYPLYCMGLVIGLAYLAGKAFAGREITAPESQIWFAATLSAFFLPQFSLYHDLNNLFPFDPAAWSLSLEALINLVYATWLYKLSARSLLAIAALSAVLLVCLTAAHGSIDLGWNAQTALGGLTRVTFSFTLGVVLFRWQPAFDLPLGRVPPIILLIALAIAFVMPIPSPWMYYDLAIVFGLFPLFTLLARHSPPHPWQVPFFSMSGRLSYAIYILHSPVIMWTTGMCKDLFAADPKQHVPLFGVVTFGIIVLISYVAAIHIDEPLRKIWFAPRPADGQVLLRKL
ncbi:MAG TPA: acyltransferase [Xanthobacteraceae bacterium]